ncbi:hypothetical protein EFL64_11810, partial [Weissella cibaria]|uniref:hypothetical protein n=1 Tax=Weissella cibaria TaxID=137591 RepID=UPI00223BAF3F
ILVNIESYKKCSSAISLQGREKSVRKSSIRASHFYYAAILDAGNFIVTILWVSDSSVGICQQRGNVLCLICGVFHDVLD